MPTVVIVGGGISGLALAYRLRQAAPHVAVTLLEKADAVLVHEDGKPVGVLTRQDLLAFLARG